MPRGCRWSVVLWGPLLGNPFWWSRFDGKTWSPPREIPNAVSGSLPVGMLLPLGAAAKGQCHLAYHARLGPEDEYTIGFIDGYFPVKLFTTHLEGDDWTRPAPLTGPSRWYYGSAAFVGNDPVQLIVSRHYRGFLGPDVQDIEYRRFEEGVWSRPERVSVGEFEAYDLSAAMDAKGQVHLVYMASGMGATTST